MSDQDHCPGCNRRIIDTDPAGCEDGDGQRWCIEHAMKAIPALAQNVVLLKRRLAAKQQALARARRTIRRLREGIAILERENTYLKSGDDDE